MKTGLESKKQFERKEELTRYETIKKPVPMFAPL
jgi:hypothetical protein